MNGFLAVAILERWQGGLWKMEVARKETNICLTIPGAYCTSYYYLMLREENEVFQN